MLGVYPQGKLQVYELELKDGRKTKCGAEHIWTIYDKKNKKYERTTKEIINSGLKNSGGFKYAVPNNAPVHFECKIYDVHPYIIGVFLGDGCCKERQLTLSSETEEIPNYVASLLKNVIAVKQNNSYSWTFRLNNPIINIKNSAYTITKMQTETIFKNYKKELCCKSEDKRIPEVYKYGSIEQRLSLIQGLMDTDGTIGSNDENRFNCKFTSTSKQLVLDMQEILFSLGYSSTISTDNREYKYTTNMCYNLSINIPNEEKYKLFKLTRKKQLGEKASQYPKHKNYSKISITNINVLSEEQEMVCIYVDNDEHLYLTNDYIVTHNTTLIKHIVAALDLPQEDVVYISYCGKACQVLRNKGCANAVTAHKLLYKSVRQRDGTFKHYPRLELERDYKLVIVDEASMLPQNMWELLLSHHIYVIACGDPGQLPPVKAESYILERPHIFLDEITRQAQESEIIRLSIDIREGKTIKYGKGKEVNVVPRHQLIPSMYTWADQIICGMNATRQDINDWYRRFSFGDDVPPEPQITDKLICCKNNWGCVTEVGEALVNGLSGEVSSLKCVPDKFRVLSQTHLLTFVPSSYDEENISEDQIFRDLPIDWQLICTGIPTITKENWRRFPKGYRLEQFDYGYAITAWKSQGSEWDKVLFLAENLSFLDKENYKKFLYTGCTRPSQKLTLVI